MVRASIAAALVSLACYSAARASECDVVMARVMDATGATYARKSDAARFLNHPLLAGAEHISIECGEPPRPPGINVALYWTGMSPPKAFYELSAKAGSAVTGDAPATLIPVMMKCRARALKEITADDPNGEVDGINVGRSEVECGAYVHDDGSTHFTIGKRR